MARSRVGLTCSAPEAKGDDEGRPAGCGRIQVRIAIRCHEPAGLERVWLREMPARAHRCPARHSFFCSPASSRSTTMLNRRGNSRSVALSFSLTHSLLLPRAVA
eukprot:1218319-Rhodomonas_salina.1